MSTGKVRPRMWKTGTLPKKSLNLALSSVALVTTSLKSLLLATTCAGWSQCCLGLLLTSQSGGLSGMQTCKLEPTAMVRPAV